jgi:hypothetical protein
MRTDSWGLYFLAAAAMSALAAWATPLPGEVAITGAFQSIPGTAAISSFFNSIATNQTLLGTIILSVLAVMYFLMPPRETVLPLAGLAGGVLMTWVVQGIVQRTGTTIFPSEPVLIYTAWLGTLALVSKRRIRADLVRKVTVGLLVLIIILAGIAQLRTEQAMFVDVAGAWLWGLTWVMWLHQSTRNIGA